MNVIRRSYGKWYLHNNLSMLIGDVFLLQGAANCLLALVPRVISISDVHAKVKEIILFLREKGFCKVHKYLCIRRATLCDYFIHW
ncbi:hypothetical protein XELAEV_18005189mg [Xenopus laevis]|uniref:Uncharacterized protein n=1 Tax=Xenopus laevis TaxID=8355 RepID=A0A974I2N6_XENLA|nr:hypothetical protein XELAEV_18005189mg [Xenopus laevis]